MLICDVYAQVIKVLLDMIRKQACLYFCSRAAKRVLTSIFEINPFDSSIFGINLPDWKKPHHSCSVFICMHMQKKQKKQLYPTHIAQ